MRDHVAHLCPVARTTQPELFLTEVDLAASSRCPGY